MDFTREVVVPAALSEILGRIFGFLFDSFLRPSSSPGDRELHRRRLERLLGNIGCMVEEAEGRQITNHQLLSHLQALTAGMYRGRFALEVTDLDDVVSSNAAGDGDGDDDGDHTTDAAATSNNAGKRSFALCPSFDMAKRSRVTSLILGGGNAAGDGGAGRLATAVEELEALTRDYMRDFILLVQGYPRKVHRPVRTTLYMDRCVFGRHVETERVVDFLLQRAPGGGRRPPYLSMLAVVGKTTLVRHACDDERVRGHFARIEWFQTPDVVHAGGEPGQYLWESGGPEYLAGVRRILAEPRFSAGPSLLVFDDAWPMDESAWVALASSASSSSSPTPALADGSKLLLICRDADLGRLGTAEPLVLRRLPPEEYWYYFKAFAFGGDPRDHPRRAAVARQISEHLERTFLDARVLGALLRANLDDARFWRRVLAAVVGCQHRPRHVGVLLELLPVRGRLLSYGFCRSPPKFTVQDVLSSTRESGRDGGSGSEEGCFFTVHLCRETLYMDHWYSITFKNDGGATPLPSPAVSGGGRNGS